MYTIVHTKECRKLAEELSTRLGESRLLDVSESLSNPDILEDFDNLGLVFHNDGKSLPLDMQNFIRDVLSRYDLSSLEYMFSICMCTGNPGHSLKIVEKLCAKIGCAPSLSMALRSGEDLDNVVNMVRSGSIQLAKGSLGTSLYMLMHGIKSGS